MKRSAAERRVLEAIRLARMAVPHYASQPLTRGDLSRLCAFNRIRIHRAHMRTWAILTPPFAGYYRLYLTTWLHSSAEFYVQLHENGHVIAGDSDEPTFLNFEGPLPEAEEVADLFALCGMITDDDCEHGGDWVESRIRVLVPIDDRGWQEHRITRLAPRVVRMRTLMREWL